MNQNKLEQLCHKTKLLYSEFGFDEEKKLELKKLEKPTYVYILTIFLVIMKKTGFGKDIYK